MSLELSRLQFPAGARHSERRKGRGTGSKMGHTCGRGVKGQKKRSGGNINKLHFQGGQTPLQRRLPKRGFRLPFPVVTVEVNLSDLERFESGTIVTEALLREARLLQVRGARVKILAHGVLTKKLTVEAYKFSKSASEKIEALGGKAVVVELAVRKSSKKDAEKA